MIIHTKHRNEFRDASDFLEHFGLLERFEADNGCSIHDYWDEGDAAMTDEDIILKYLGEMDRKFIVEFIDDRYDGYFMVIELREDV